MADEEALKNATNFATLPSGRQLCYALYGADPADAITTVFYFHGFLSCRLEPAAIHGLAASRRVRIITADRPGYGRSPHDPHRTLESVADDIGHLLEQLLEPEQRVVMMGASGGAPYAATTASRHPHRTAHVLLNVPFFPVAGREDLMAGMSSSGQRILRNALHSPVRTHMLLSLTWCIQRMPFISRDALLRIGGFAEVDKETQKAFPDKSANIRRASKEATRSGISGAIRDLRVLAGAPLATEVLDRVGCPVNIWAGKLDRVTPVAMAELYAALLSKENGAVDLRVVEDLGHFLSYRHMPDILASAGMREISVE